MRPELDHLVLGCLSLAKGRPALEARLGVPAQGGGVHTGAGTHNALWGLDGGAAFGRIYLELIAPDPDQPRAPGETLPFGLHRPETRARLADGPRLIAWMARCTGVDDWAPRAPALGPVGEMSRGALTWRLTHWGAEGPAHDGAMPGLIEWPEGTVMPGDAMAGSGLRLIALHRRPDAAAGATLAALGLALPEGETGGGPLRAVIEGPAGPVTLD